MWKRSYTEDEVEYVDCPLCSASDPQDIADEWSLIIARCKQCGMEYVRRRVVNPEWNYRGDEDALLRKYGPFLEDERPHDRERNYQEMLDRLEPYRGQGSRLLDVGPHMGFFLRAARRRGWDVVGVEQSPVLADVARTRMGLDVRAAYLEETGFREEFDVVTFTDVLEHISNPVTVLNHARNSLRTGGAVLVKVPHARWNHLKYRTIKRILGHHLDAYDGREHILQFTASTLKEAFRKAGLSPVELFVPLPVQTGGPAKRAARWLASEAGIMSFRLLGTPTALCTDLVMIGQRAS